ncbi:MAG: hypothetical protein ACKOCT_04690 [Alphaproteobacteria bacterium]
MMDARTRRRGLLAAVLLLVLFDVGLRRFDLLSALSDDTMPATFFAAVNSQVIDAVRTLRSGRPREARPIVLMGNSQMDFGARPLPLLRDALLGSGAAPGTEVVPLFVYASTVTDAEVLSREVGRLHPSVVVLGVSAPDMGTTLDVARGTPVHRILDVGLTDGPVSPGSVEERLDRWVRTAWQGFAQRSLYADLLFPPPGRRAAGATEGAAAGARDSEGPATTPTAPTDTRGETPAPVRSAAAAVQGPASARASSQPPRARKRASRIQTSIRARTNLPCHGDLSVLKRPLPSGRSDVGFPRARDGPRLPIRCMRPWSTSRWRRGRSPCCAPSP